jgi:hypothetical protein
MNNALEILKGVLSGASAIIEVVEGFVPDNIKSDLEIADAAIKTVLGAIPAALEAQAAAAAAK